MFTVHYEADSTLCWSEHQEGFGASCRSLGDQCQFYHFWSGSIFCKYFCTDIPKGTVNMAYWACAYDVFPLLNLLRCLVTKKSNLY